MTKGSFVDMPAETWGGDSSDRRVPRRDVMPDVDPVGVPPNYGNGVYERPVNVLNSADGGGLRYNAGKNRIELIPPEWVWALGDVTTQGSKKYAERNWERGMDWSNMVGCMERHLLKFMSGERYDGSKFDIKAGTTGCHHLAMVAWNALALMSYDLRGVGNNNLPALPDDLLALVNAMGVVGPDTETRDDD